MRFTVLAKVIVPITFEVDVEDCDDEEETYNEARNIAESLTFQELQAMKVSTPERDMKNEHLDIMDVEKARKLKTAEQLQWDKDNPEEKWPQDWVGEY